MPRRKKVEQPRTTAQQLGSIIKSARQIMRKDKGLSGDLDRLPILTWVMFLKFLDDLEQLRETEAVLEGKAFQPAIQPPYRWRDWAAVEGGITGDELIAFINQEQAVLPDGTEGPGLFFYLRNLQGANGGDRRDVIATVFKGLQNRMLNGYLLRDVIDKINGIHFNASEEMHTLSRLYETMLREMRDAAGDSGEFYTPRPVVRFMVAVTDPKLGQTILDPACGTGGFLVEAMRYLEKQCKTVEDRDTLQNFSLYGGEAKTLPYLLVQMNLLLHGLEYPRIDPGNSLRFPLREIGDKDRVDMILTNPPFGGEEEKGIFGNFPEDMQTAETALLFLQLIMRKLKRPGKGSEMGGRAAVVLPNGILSQEGVAERVREMVLNNFNLHTIVRLPRGVFEPYTRSSTSLLFFDASGPTKKIWFYDVPVRDGIKAYSMNQAFQFEELSDCIDWWNERLETQWAWQVDVLDIASDKYRLTLTNPSLISGKTYPDPTKLESQAAQSINKLNEGIAHLIKVWPALEERLTGANIQHKPLSEILNQKKREISLIDYEEYQVLGMRWYAKGLYVKHRKKGCEIKAKKLYVVRSGDFVYNRLFAWKGSFAEAGDDVDGCVVSNEFPCFVEKADSEIVLGYIWAFFSQQLVWHYIEGLSTGTSSTSRLRLKESRFLELRIPIPPRGVQEELADVWKHRLLMDKCLENLSAASYGLAPSIIERLIPPSLE